MPTRSAPLFDRFADAKVVLLGEASHGTSEFYRARAAITRRLIERHGFTIVAVEADWPDAARIDAYVRHHAPFPGKERAFARFPTWMWRNVEVRDFVQWLRAENEHRPPERRAEFRGLDVYSLNASIDAVLRYLDKVDPEAANEARGRYGCLSPWQSDPARYGRAVATGHKRPCDEALLDQLQDLLGHRLDYVDGSAEAYFDAVQNARIARAAEHYYRIMYEGSTASWNLRDRHMFDTLQHVLDRRGEGAKAVVWAHNSHIGNAAATAMGWQGEFNIGELVPHRLARRRGADRLWHRPRHGRRGVGLGRADGGEAGPAVAARQPRARLPGDRRSPARSPTSAAATASCGRSSRSPASSAPSASSIARRPSATAIISRRCWPSSSTPSSGSRRRAPSPPCRRATPRACPRPTRSGFEPRGRRSRLLPRF